MAEETGEETEPLTWRAYAGVGVLWFASTQVLSWGGVEAAAPYRWVAAVVFVTLGAACWYNGRACGAIHCRISGPGYVLLGLLASVSALGVVDVSVETLTAAFVAIAVLSYVIEIGFRRSRASVA